MAAPLDDSTDAPLGRREQNKADKLLRIRRAAARLFAEQGFDATTTADVARAAGVAKGTVFLYAPTKRDLLAAVFIEQAGSAWEAAFAAVDPGAGVLDQVSGAFDHVAREHDRDPLLSTAMFKELQFVDGPLSTELRSFLDRWFEQLDGVVAAGVERGELRADTPTNDVAFGLYAAWFMVMQRRFGADLDPARARARYRRSFAVQLAGWMADRPDLEP